MRDIQHIAISVGRHADATDIAISHGINLLSLHALSLDVETSMDMVGTDFTKGGGKVNRDVDRLAVLGKLLGNTTQSERQCQ